MPVAGPCPTSQARSASGSATVAERPMVLRPGASDRRRARPRESRSPRLLVTSACSSSRMTVSRSAKKRSASGAERSSAACSGVVSRISGGFSFWRWRLWSEVSPVRVSRRTASPISATGSAPGCGRYRRPAPSAARRRGCGCRDRRVRSTAGAREARRDWAGSRRASCRRRWGRSTGSSGRPWPWRAASIWCGRGTQPRAANQAAKGAGRSPAGSEISARAVTRSQVTPARHSVHHGQSHFSARSPIHPPSQPQGPR